MRRVLAYCGIAIGVLGFSLALNLGFTNSVRSIELIKDNAKRSEGEVDEKTKAGKDKIIEFKLPSASKPIDCHNFCTANSECRAWNYLKPKKKEPASCTLLKAITDATDNKEYATGVVFYDVKFNVTLAGDKDTVIFIPRAEDETWRWKACKALCDADGKCKSWTYVRWVKSDPAKDSDAYPRCRLNTTTTIPAEKADDCCIAALR